MGDLQHRVNDWLSGRPETQAIRDYYVCERIFGFDHAATRGCLLALVRQAWVGHTPQRATQAITDVSVEWYGDWTVESVPDGLELSHGVTSLEALVAALEAAP